MDTDYTQFFEGEFSLYVRARSSLAANPPDLDALREIRGELEELERRSLQRATRDVLSHNWVNVEEYRALQGVLEAAINGDKDRLSVAAGNFLCAARYREDNLLGMQENQVLRAEMAEADKDPVYIKMMRLAELCSK